MNEVIYKAITDTATTLVISMLPVLAGIGIACIRKIGKKVELEISQVSDEQERKLLWEAYESLDDIAEKTVRKFEQTTASKLKTAAENGKLTESDAKQLASDVYTEVIQTLHPDYQACLKDNLGNLEGYVVSCIEDKVLKLKGR